MAVTTRGITAPKAPAPKASSRHKAPSRSKSASRTKSASKTARGTAPGPPAALKIPAIPSLGMASSDYIEETDIEARNDRDAIRRLIRSELAKARDAQPSVERANTHRVRKSRSRRRHRRSGQYSSSELNIDSEEGDRPLVSFLHYFRRYASFL